MSLKCGGICNDHFVANFVPSQSVKEFGKLINILRNYQCKYCLVFVFFTRLYNLLALVAEDLIWPL